LIYRILAFVVAAVFLVSIFAFDDSWAVKSHGSKLTSINSDKICGLELCSDTKKIDEKISDYLKNIEKSSITLSVNEDLSKNLAPIIKTSIISNDFLLVHYSDGNWDIINRSTFADEIPMRGIDGSFDLGSDAEKTVGRLAVSESVIVRPVSSSIKQITINGNVGEQASPNILLQIDFPDRPAQDFILSVNNTGSFEAEFNIKNDTPLGVYRVTATYSSALVGSVSFEIVKNEILAMAAHGTDIQISSITLSTNQVTIPSSNAQIHTIQVSGEIADYHRGNMIQIILVSPNGEESPRMLTATKDGIFSTFIKITPEFSEGVNDIILKYLGKEVARTSLTITSPIFTLQ